MADSLSDSWTAGDAYDHYMGRWSRRVARRFVEWLRPPDAASWLEVGCGTGALTAVVLDEARPRSIVACDASRGFIDHAQRKHGSALASFVVADAAAPPRIEGGFDVAVSGLLLNFLADPTAVVRELRVRMRPGGLVAAYVWDYAGGVELLDAFWSAAVEQRREVEPLDECRRFSACSEPSLAVAFRAAGLEAVESATLSIEMRFDDFTDCWEPFLRGTGPAPAYVATLTPEQRSDLRERMRARLAGARDGEDDGAIVLTARAIALRGRSGGARR